VADDLRKNFSLGLWVPAFAGTTTVYVAPAIDLPDEWRSQNPVNPRAQKYFDLQKFGFGAYCRHPASIFSEGRFADVTTREAGMRWTRMCRGRG